MLASGHGRNGLEETLWYAFKELNRLGGGSSLRDKEPSERKRETREAVL